ncbi:MAG: AzlD domain-containing protein [Chloroflexaceae bacterium]|nr:AzlD domain-containing protein [Chloroflexaceae bacterium]
MSEAAIWLLFLAIGALTLTFRAALIVLAGRLAIPPLILRALRFVPSAVLSALIVPPLVFYQGQLHLLGQGWLNERVLAGIIAAAVMWRTKRVLLAISVGMVALWGLQFLIYQLQYMP